MSTPVKTPSAGAPSEASNRVKLGLSNRILARPEVGALVAAIVIFIFFLIAAPSFRSAGSSAVFVMDQNRPAGSAPAYEPDVGASAARSTRPLASPR